MLNSVFTQDLEMLTEVRPAFFFFVCGCGGWGQGVPPVSVFRPAAPLRLDFRSLGSPVLTA